MIPDIERLAKEAGKICFTPVYGRVELSTFTDWRADGGHGMGRKRVFDEVGNLVSDDVIELGSRIFWEDAPEPIGWFRRLTAAIRAKFALSNDKPEAK